MAAEANTHTVLPEFISHLPHVSLGVTKSKAGAKHGEAYNILIFLKKVTEAKKGGLRINHISVEI